MAVYKRNPQGKIVKDDEKGTWFYDFVIEGRRYKKSLAGIRTRKQAEKIEENKRFEVYSGNSIDKSKRIAFKQFVTEIYLPYQKLRGIRSFKNYEYFCEEVCQFFKNKTLQEIENDPDLIERWIAHRCNGLTYKGTKRQRNTVNREKGMLSGIFRLAVKKKYCKSNPCKSVDSLPDAPNRRTAVLKPEDETQLLAALDGDKEKYRPIVVLGLNTGMRRNEILGLRWEWIDLIAGEINLPASITKNRKDRRVLLNHEATNVLIQLWQADPTAKRVFPRTPRSGFSPNNVSKVIATACDDIGKPEATLHATRRTFNTRLIEKNTNPFAVKELMGHSNFSMTDHYTHLSRETLIEVVKTLEKQPDNTASVPGQQEGDIRAEANQ